MKRLIFISLSLILFGGYVFSQELDKDKKNNISQVKLFCPKTLKLDSLTNFLDTCNVLENIKWDSCYMQRKFTSYYDRLKQTDFFQQYIKSSSEKSQNISLTNFSFKDSLPISLNIRPSLWKENREIHITNIPDVEKVYIERLFHLNPVSPEEEFLYYREKMFQKLFEYNYSKYRSLPIKHLR